MIQRFSLSHFGNSAGSKKRRDSETLSADGNIFSLESFYVSDYIQRHLRRSKMLKEKHINTDARDKIVSVNIGLNFDNTDLKLFSESRVLSCHSKFDYQEIKPLRGSCRSERFLKPILEVVPNLENHISGITPIILEIIDGFQKDNFRNIWEYSRKKIKGVGTAKILCELTPLFFLLRLTIEDKNKVVLFNKPIMETMPDSLFFHHRFRSLVISDDNKIIVTQRLKETPLFSISVDDALEVGVDNIIYHQQKNVPEWWLDFRKCMGEPEGVHCPPER